MKTIDEWSSDLDKMYEIEHPAAERFIKRVIESIYDDVVKLIESEHMYDDGLVDLIHDRMLEVLGDN